jgi:hypothetical protein
LQNWFFCHPERSEGSQPSENTRFFALLRMTIVVKGEFCKSLKSFFRYGACLKTKIPPNPPLSKGGTTRNCFKSPPLEKVMAIIGEIRQMAREAADRERKTLEPPPSPLS